MSKKVVVTSKQLRKEPATKKAQARQARVLAAKNREPK